ncbi:hypothetical protein ACIBQX_04275 [Nonomuraea sp. NPDC049714]|uniref:hypothetical protein n=1 Tax=Nonomuraea sp. NPDC049714 TaxID=3364357 RepID=UPI0037B0BF2E
MKRVTTADAGTSELTGGRMTAGVVLVDDVRGHAGVVHQDDTVRRPVSPSSAFVAALLRLLEQRDFDGAPRYLGHADPQRGVVMDCVLERRSRDARALNEARLLSGK